MSPWDHCLSESVWVASLKIMFSSSIHFPAKFKMSLFFSVVNGPHFSYPFFDRSIEGHLGCFQVLAMTNKAAVNIVEHMSL